MDRFFFDTQDGDKSVDDDGVECASADDAVLEAVKFAGSMISDRPTIVQVGRDFEVVLRDHARRKVAAVRVSLWKD